MPTNGYGIFVTGGMEATLDTSSFVFTTSSTDSTTANSGWYITDAGTNTTPINLQIISDDGAGNPIDVSRWSEPIEITAFGDHQRQFITPDGDIVDERYREQIEQRNRERDQERERHRQEAIGRLMAHDTEQQMAEEKAVALLKDLFGEIEGDYLIVPSGLHKDREYRIPLDGGMVQTWVKGERNHALCLHVGAQIGVPKTDEVIGRALFLEADEGAFLERANIHP